jgi:hypothetical protein
MATPLCRREPPTEMVPVIINFGAPFRLFDQADPSRWTRPAASRPVAYDSYVPRRIDRTVGGLPGQPVDPRRALFSGGR